MNMHCFVVLTVAADVWVISLGVFKEGLTYSTPSPNRHQHTHVGPMSGDVESMLDNLGPTFGPTCMGWAGQG